MIRLSTDPTASHTDRYDLLLAIDWQNVGRFAAEMPLDANSLVIGDPAMGEAPAEVAAMGARSVELPMQGLSKENKGWRPNMLALGAVSALVGVPQEHVFAVIAKKLKRKGEEAIALSIEAAKGGMRAAGDMPEVPKLGQGSDDVSNRWSITGNEAAGLGAVRGGVRFVAAYPITPGTEILEWLAPSLKKLGGVLVQAEDELASVTQIIGASFGGRPALTATSGPGLALMMESIGLSVASETPIVVIDVQRGGPSTGIPTKSEQSDLNIALYGLHGDAPHLVVAPLSIGDCLFTAQWAVHLAEAIQTACIVLSDQSMGQSRAIIDRPADIAFMAKREQPQQLDENYRRYAITASGISPMSIPGVPGGQYCADGLEHSPKGTPSSLADDHYAQSDKRLKKLTAFNYGDHWAEIEGSGTTAVLTWGSCSGPVREAVRRLRDAGQPVRLVAMRLISPAQPEKMAAALEGVERLLVVEQSHGAQFFRYLRAHYDLPGDVKSFHRPGPLPIRPNEIHQQLVSWS